MITSIVIGSITLSGTGSYVLNGVRGLELPPIRLASYDLAGADFGRFVSSFFGRRRFALEGVVIGEDATDFIAKRNALIVAVGGSGGEQIITITTSDGRVLRIVAALAMFDFPPQAGIPAAAMFRAEFEAAVPFLESANAVAYSLTLPTGGGGKVPPDTMPMALAFGQGGSAFVTNAGNAPALPTVRIAGPVTNPALRNNATNQELSFDIVLVTGESLDVDFRQKTVTDHSGRNRFDTKGGDWWSLAPGVSEIRFVADSTDPAALVTLTVRDTYLGT
jgi:hypothetical protein